MSKILSVPEQARGMTTLDETAFKKTVVFPVLHVGVQDLNKIRGKVRLEKYLVKNLANVKNVADSEDPTEKLLLFDPDIIHEAGEDLKTTIAEQVAAVSETTPRWDVKEIPVSFDNWDSRSVFRAILPDGLEFSSFTQTGHIIHCNFHADLAPYKSIIGEILLRKVRQAKTVVNKVDGIATKYRNFEIELVAGEENYLTTVTERGINYKMDFSKVFWNSRLQHEHERVTQFLTKNSLVFDACAGIGPFVLPAAKQKRCRIVYANDLNPESIKWLETNRDSNKIQPEQVRTFNMDAAEFIKGPVATKIAEEFNSVIGEGGKKPEDAHIIMNLPAYSVNFLPAFDGLLQGKIDEVQNKNVFPILVYCYLFVKAHEDVESSWFVDRAYEMVKEKLGWTDENLDKRITAHHVRTVSTRKEMFCMRISLPIDYLLCGEKEPAAKKAKKEEE